MFIGILFVVAGVLIALYPPLLSFIVAALFISIGITLLSISYHYKRMQRNFDDPFMRFFSRF